MEEKIDGEDDDNMPDRKKIVKVINRFDLTHVIVDMLIMMLTRHFGALVTEKCCSESCELRYGNSR